LILRLLKKNIIFQTSLGVAIFFMIMGILFWGSFNMAMEKTNEMEFCISCHEMKDHIYENYKLSTHYKNQSGVRATCPDCHVPREWEHMLVRKISATSELFYKMTGSIDTPEKFNARQLMLAQKVWSSMQETDSRECRNCHEFSAMDLNTQKNRSETLHALAAERKKTCIDCHKGITHTLPENIEVSRGGSDEDHEFYAQRNIPCYQCHENMPKPDLSEW